jgi:hypothetical protein
MLSHFIYQRIRNNTVSFAVLMQTLKADLEMNNIIHNIYLSWRIGLRCYQRAINNNA